MLLFVFPPLLHLSSQTEIVNTFIFLDTRENTNSDVENKIRLAAPLKFFFLFNEKNNWWIDIHHSL